MQFLRSYTYRSSVPSSLVFSLAVLLSFHLFFSRQITFSQIDSTVLGALPPDLRREVMDQLEAHQRQRRAPSSSSPPFRSLQARANTRVGLQQLADVPSPQASARARVGQQHSVDSPAEATAESAASAAGRNRIAGHSRARTGAVPNRLEVVREGFDVTSAREGSARPQQVGTGATVIGRSRLCPSFSAVQSRSSE